MEDLWHRSFARHAHSSPRNAETTRLSGLHFVVPLYPVGKIMGAMIVIGIRHSSVEICVQNSAHRCSRLGAYSIS